MLIRRATQEDAQTLFDLRNAAIRAQCAGHYPATDLEKWTAGPMSDAFARNMATRCHVVEVGGEIVGMGMLDLANGQVDAIFVRPDAMGQGVGRAMMRFIEQQARVAGLTQLCLDSTLNAALFYRSVGFCGEVVSVYQSPRGISLACIPMTKQLA
ncbi:MAG: GNAT family N-acetyltransferase [Burkholderiales bacterium]|nr:GNAT family N-acetyltransferase [Burkholderiales bacterium]